MIKNPRFLLGWAFSLDTAPRDAVDVLEFVRDHVLVDPDFGYAIDDHTRGAIVPRTSVQLIWSFDRLHRTVEIITPV
jgi:hypothetical protein